MTHDGHTNMKFSISRDFRHEFGKNPILNRHIHEAYRWPHDGHTMDTRIAHDYTRRIREDRETGSFAFDVVANGTRRPHDGFTVA